LSAVVFALSDPIFRKYVVELIKVSNPQKGASVLGFETLKVGGTAGESEQTSSISSASSAACRFQPSRRKPVDWIFVNVGDEEKRKVLICQYKGVNKVRPIIRSDDEVKQSLEVVGPDGRAS